MKKLVLLSAMALSVGSFMTSCEKEEITSNENQSRNLDDKLIHQTNQEKSIGYFQFVLPDELSSLELESDEDADVIIEESEFSMIDEGGDTINGSLRMSMDPALGRITNVEASEIFLNNGLLSPESLVLAFANPTNGFDLEEDIVQPATMLGSCVRACQAAYTTNVAGCTGEDSEACRKEQKRMKNSCITGCYIGAGITLALGILTALSV